MLVGLVRLWRRRAQPRSTAGTVLSGLLIGGLLLRLVGHCLGAHCIGAHCTGARRRGGHAVRCCGGFRGGAAAVNVCSHHCALLCEVLRSFTSFCFALFRIEYLLSLFSQSHINRRNKFGKPNVDESTSTTKYLAKKQNYHNVQENRFARHESREISTLYLLSALVLVFLITQFHCILRSGKW
jgi:hypothetical protein